MCISFQFILINYIKENILYYMYLKIHNKVSEIVLYSVEILCWICLWIFLKLFSGFLTRTPELNLIDKMMNWNMWCGKELALCNSEAVLCDELLTPVECWLRDTKGASPQIPSHSLCPLFSTGMSSNLHFNWVS